MPTNSKPILGVDLGSMYMKVALVQRNAPLEIIVNMHSKRKTEQMVLFDQGTRFYGSDASSLIARKPTFTPYAMNMLLGRDESHPVVKSHTERHNPLPSYHNETRAGVCLSVSSTSYTPEELVSMVLTHAKDFTVADGVAAPIKDCVLTVPSFFTQHERRAFLDAATLADLNVLALIDENTAAGLHFGIDRIEEKPLNVLFYNMGGHSIQVSIIQFHSHEKNKKKIGAFRVLGKGWDSNLGGQSFDARLVDFMADEFNEVWNKKRNDGVKKDVRAYPRPISKLKIMANKVKHVLSANNDMPIFIDSLHDDTNYQSHMSRATFEEICHDLILKTTNPINMALDAANVTLAEINAVELIGGGMRIPRVQEQISQALGESLELGMHINSDESMALGAAFHGANVSTAFRVRQVGMTDINPFPIAVTLKEMEVEESAGLFGLGGGKKVEEEGAEVWSKQATIFKANGKVGVKKTIAFTQENEINVAIDYLENEQLPEGTALAIERYNVTGVAKFAQDMEKKGLGKPKVSLQFDLSTSGLAMLVKAEAAVEEIYTVEEDVEVEDEEAEEEEAEEEEVVQEEVEEEVGKTADVESNAKETSKESEKEEKSEASSEDKEETTEEKLNEEEKVEESEKDEKGEDDPEKKEKDTTEPEDGTKEDSKETGKDKKEEKGEKKEKKKKKMKTIKVEKEKKRVHKVTLNVDTYHVGRVQPYSTETLQESRDKLAAMAAADAERIRFEEVKNKYESYIYHIKNKLIDEEEAITAVTTQEQRDAMLKSSQDAENWMYDEGYDADLVTYEEKYVELYEPAEKVFFRVAEVEARPKVLKDIEQKLDKIIALLTKWETTMPQVTAEERAEVATMVDEVRKSIAEKVAAQDAADPTEDPVFKSADIPPLTKDIQSKLGKLSKRPKPKVEKKEEKKEEKEEEKEEEKDKDSTANKDDSEEESAGKTEDNKETQDDKGTEEETEKTSEAKEDNSDASTEEKVSNDEDEISEEEKKTEDEL